MKVTGRGVGVLVAGVLLLVVAGALNYPELAAIGTGALVALALSLAGGLIRPRLTVARSVGLDRVMRGESCEATLAVSNERPWGAITAVGADRCAGPDRQESEIPIPLVQLPAGQTVTIRYFVPTQRRGVLRLGPLRVGRHDPFGLVRAQRPFGGESEVRVYPYLHPIAALPSGLSRSPDGLTERVPHGNIAFDALREYVPGDELRHVHWRTSARIGELMVREQVDTSLPGLVVLLDDRAAVHHGETFEYACEAAGSLFVAALRENLAVHLLTPSGISTAVPSHSAAYLDRLSEARLHSDAELGRGGLGRAGLGGIAERARQLRTGDTLVCLTGRPGDEDLATLVGLRGTYASLVVAVFDPHPVGLTAAGIHVIGAADGAEFARLWNGLWT
jgi:uncharacterized protein (DUF58 family)